MKKLRESCSGLSMLIVAYADMNSIEVKDLPVHLEQLSFIRCEIPLKWFNGANFENLKVLNLKGSSRICSNHLQDLASVCSKTLHTLVLTSCYRIDDRTVEILVNERFDTLTRLHLEDTGITKLAIHLICTRLSNSLCELNVKDCKHVTKSDIDFIRNSFVNSEDFILIC